MRYARVPVAVDVLTLKFKTYRFSDKCLHYKNLTDQETARFESVGGSHGDHSKLFADVPNGPIKIEILSQSGFGDGRDWIIRLDLTVLRSNSGAATEEFRQFSFVNKKQHFFLKVLPEPRL